MKKIVNKKRTALQLLFFTPPLWLEPRKQFLLVNYQKELITKTPLWSNLFMFGNAMVAS